EVCILILPAIVVGALHRSDSAAVATMGWTLIALLPIAVLASVFGARENLAPPQPHLDAMTAVRTVWENKVARRVLLPDLLLGIAQGVSGGLFVFYFRFVLGFARESEILLLIYFTAGLFGIPIWWWMARRFGKDRALLAAFLYTSVTTTAL